MAEQMNMPSGMGGLLRYNEEYPSKFLLKPAHVVAFVISLIVFAIGLRFFFPIK